MGYNGVLMGHVQNSITWAVEGSYGVGVKDSKLAVWYRKWDGSTTACPGVNAPAVSENTTLYPGEFAFISLVTSNDGRTFKVYKNGKEAISKPNEAIDQSAYVCYESQKMGIVDWLFKEPAGTKTIVFSSSIPLEITSVATKISILLFLKSSMTDSRSDCSKSECIASTLYFGGNRCYFQRYRYRSNRIGH